MNNKLVQKLASAVRNDFQNVSTIFFMPAMYIARGLVTGLSCALRASEQALLSTGREASPLPVKSKTRDEAGAPPRVRAIGR